MNINFENKIILVTGSTSGIGRQIAKQLLENKAKVIINYGHNESLAQETMEELSMYRDNILLIKCDLSKENEVDEMFNKISEKFDKLDGLVNCAAYDKVASIEDLTIDEYRHEIDVNIVARWQCIKNAIPLMKKSDAPRVINIASRLGTRPMEESVAYCTCEAATIMLTKCCALELAKYNIKVNTVSPSLTLTPLSMKSYSEEEIRETAAKNPSNRLGTVEDTANLVLFLLSDKADYINGENINVNGGILLK
ncbi:MAG: SDR family oxidoreductase [Bacilli bacterium]|nr:SDR family oxidoreductase [Bacilli bacterium]